MLTGASVTPNRKRHANMLPKSLAMYVKRQTIDHAMQKPVIDEHEKPIPPHKRTNLQDTTMGELCSESCWMESVLQYNQRTELR